MILMPSFKPSSSEFYFDENMISGPNTSGYDDGSDTTLQGLIYAFVGPPGVTIAGASVNWNSNGSDNSPNPYFFNRDTNKLDWGDYSSLDVTLTDNKNPQTQYVVTIKPNDKHAVVKKISQSYIDESSKDWAVQFGSTFAALASGVSAVGLAGVADAAAAESATIATNADITLSSANIANTSENAVNQFNPYNFSDGESLTASTDAQNVDFGMGKASLTTNFSPPKSGLSGNISDEIVQVSVNNTPTVSSVSDYGIVNTPFEAPPVSVDSVSSKLTTFVNNAQQVVGAVKQGVAVVKGSVSTPTTVTFYQGGSPSTAPQRESTTQETYRQAYSAPNNSNVLLLGLGALLLLVV